MEHDEHTEPGEKVQEGMPEPTEQPGGTLGRDDAPTIEEQPGGGTEEDATLDES